MSSVEGVGRFEICGGLGGTSLTSDNQKNNEGTNDTRKMLNVIVNMDEIELVKYKYTKECPAVRLNKMFLTLSGLENSLILDPDSSQWPLCCYGAVPG